MVSILKFGLIRCKTALEKGLIKHLLLSEPLGFRFLQVSILTSKFESTQ